MSQPETKRVFLHVGLPKSGTSYIQAILAENKRSLRKAGLLFPGKSWVDQIRAVQDVRRMPVRANLRQERKGAWAALVSEVTQWRGDAVISMEWLCAASPEQVERIVTDLAPAEVHVVVTVRDLSQSLPASWQEGVKNMRDRTWRDFLGNVSGANVDLDPQEAGAVKRFWTRHDLVSVLERWGGHVTPEHTHVVTVPRPGCAPDELWQRMCQVFGIDGSEAVTEGLVTNESLDLETVEMLRRLLPLARSLEVTKPAYAQAIIRGLARKGVPGAPRGTRLQLPPDQYAWVLEHTERVLTEVRDRGVRVVGDLDELRPRPPAEPSPQPEDLGSEELLESALKALAATLRELDIVMQSAREATTANDEDAAEPEPATPPRRGARLLGRRSGG